MQNTNTHRGGEMAAAETNTREMELSRVQMVTMFGEEKIEKLDAENCELTGRCGYNGISHGDPELEFRATISVEHPDWETISAVYLMSNHDEHECDEVGDYGYSDFEIDHYRVY